MLKLDLEKAEEPEIKLPTSVGLWKSKRIPGGGGIYFCFNDYAKCGCVDHNKLWKILKEMRIPDHLTCLLRILYAVRKQQSKLLEQQLWNNRLIPNRKRSTSRLYIVTLLI